MIKKRMRKKSGFKIQPMNMFDTKAEAERQVKKYKQFNKKNSHEFPYLLTHKYEIRKVEHLKIAKVGTHRFKYGIYMKKD